MITELDGKFHIRLNAKDRAHVLHTMRETEIEAVFFGTSRDDLLVVLSAMEDAVFLTMMFAP